MLIDREEIVNNILLGYGEPLYGPLLPLHFAYQQKDNNYKVDLAAARRLLVEAGGTDLKLTLIYNVGNTVRENVALMLKEKAAAIGLEIEIKLLEWEAFLAALNNGDYDLAILGRGVEADPDLSFHWHSQSPGNSLAYHNKQVDQLLTQAVTTSERSKRGKNCIGEARADYRGYSAVWLYARRAVHAATARLKILHPILRRFSLMFMNGLWTPGGNTMILSLFRRLAQTIIVLFGVSVVTFSHAYSTGSPSPG